MTTKQLFVELLEKYSTKYIKDKLELNINTINRWIKQDKVPDNYFNDFNFLLDEKYDNTLEYRQKDQFYTNGKISKYCYDKMIEVLKDIDIDTDDYVFVEPSAGCCNFYNLLPKDRRIGVDIDPKGDDKLIKSNYLNYIPKENNKHIVIGNPPFGLRGNLALRFINHSSSFADVVAFILPPLFDSDGKGVPQKRVKGYVLAHSEKLPSNSFEYPDGTEVKVATIFQVWTKINTDKIVQTIKKTCSSYIKVYSLSDGGTPSSTRNKNMLYRCDAYLPSTCFGGMRAYDGFEELPHRRGYGIVMLQKTKELKKLFYDEINWEKASFSSTNSALNLRTSLIEQEIVKYGYHDENLYATG
ncbi:MAG: restriction endonuclease subunit M [Epsilonproteobacteria bacterium]|nr:MAG: restriction endonuclease subunit M [Campylobacterota bacterium]